MFTAQISCRFVFCAICRCQNSRFSNTTPNIIVSVSYARHVRAALLPACNPGCDNSQRRWEKWTNLKKSWNPFLQSATRSGCIFLMIVCKPYGFNLQVDIFSLVMAILKPMTSDSNSPHKPRRQVKHIWSQTHNYIAWCMPSKRKTRELCWMEVRRDMLPTRKSHGESRFTTWFCFLGVIEWFFQTTHVPFTHFFLSRATSHNFVLRSHMHTFSENYQHAELECEALPCPSEWGKTAQRTYAWLWKQ